MLGLVLALLGGECVWCIKQLSLNSDLLYLESYYNDLIVNHRAFSHFAFSECLFFFPDFLIYALVRPLSGSALDAIAAFTVVSFALEAGLIYFIYRKVARGREDLFVSGLALFLLLYATAPYYLWMGFYPNYHGSLQRLFLLAVLFVLSRDGRLNWKWIFGLALTGFASVFSDFLSFPTVVAPLAAYLVMRHRDWPAAFILALGGVAAFALNTWMIYSHHMTGIPFGIGGDENDHLKMILTLKTFPLSLPRVLFENYALTLAVLVAGVATYFRSHLAKTEKTYLIFAGLAFTSASGAILFSGRWPIPAGFERYFQCALYLPAIWVSVFAWARVGGGAKVHLTLATAIALILAGFAWRPSDSLLTAKPAVARCLDEHVTDLPTPWGLGGYYLAKLVTFTSEKQLHVNQVKKNMSGYFWMISPEWYGQDIYGRTIEGRHSYVVARDAAEATRVVEKWGPPSKTFNCDRDVSVLIYKSNLIPGNFDLSPND